MKGLVACDGYVEDAANGMIVLDVETLEDGVVGVRGQDAESSLVSRKLAAGS